MHSVRDIVMKHLLYTNKSSCTDDIMNNNFNQPINIDVKSSIFADFIKNGHIE